jgi:hypothetical protein
MVVKDEKVKAYAKLAEGSYEMAEKGKSREERISAINKQVEGTGFSVVDDKKYSNPNITTYRNDKTGEVHVAHKGTNIKGRRGMKDVRNDFAIALGLQKLDPRFKRRTKSTERVIKDLAPEKFTMSGHSLGNGTMQYAIANSRKIRQNLDEAHSFNGAANPILSADLKVSKKDKKELDEKVTHHRIRGDVVSAGFKTANAFGKVKRYDVKHDEESGKGLINKIVKSSPVLSKVSQLTSKALHAHHLFHFHQ